MKHLIPILAIAIAIAIAGVALTLLIQQRAGAKLRDNDAVLQQRDQQLSELAAEQHRLSALVAQADSSRREDSTAELAKLRDQAEALRKQTNELGQQLQQSRAAQPSPTASQPVSHPPEYYARLHQTAGSKGVDARNLAQALLMHASEHAGQFPSSLDQVGPYLRKQDLSLSGTNEFELIYRGSLEELKKIPSGSVALFRDRQTWRAPSGKLARVYGMANGSGQIVESDDDFQAWEAGHILPSPPPGR